MFEGPVPLEQMQAYTRVSYVEDYNQYSWKKDCGSSNVECESIAVSKKGTLAMAVATTGKKHLPPCSYWPL